jgi:hypothetical protein
LIDTIQDFWCETRAATAAKDAKDWSLPSFGSHLNPISTKKKKKKKRQQKSAPIIFP